MEHIEHYKYQLVEFKPLTMSYWAMKKVIYDDQGNPVSIEEPRLSHSEIYAEAIVNPRIRANEHNWKDTP